MFEKSKAFSKRFMEKYHIATAKYLETDSIDEAKKYAYELISEDVYKRQMYSRLAPTLVSRRIFILMILTILKSF